MRRKEREITDITGFIKVLNDSKVCHVGINGAQYPYVVPLSFGFKQEAGIFTFYFHCAKEGMKIDMIKQEPKVCLEFEADLETVSSEVPCGYSMLYSSVIAFGDVEFLETENEKREALNLILKQYDAVHLMNDKISYSDLKHVTCFKVTVSEITGKCHLK